MSGRLIVDRDALAELIAAASEDRPGPRVRAALVALIDRGTRPAPEPRPWMSVTEAARALGVSERTVRDHANRGELTHQRIGRRLLIHHTAVAAPDGTVRSGAETPDAPDVVAADDDRDAA